MSRRLLLSALAIVLALTVASAARSDVWLQLPGPILTATQPWEQTAVDEPSVLYSKTAGWKMWYSGGWTTCGTGYATSADGVNWTKYAGNPIIPGRCRNSGPVVVAGTYYIFTADNSYYTGVGKLILSTSTDGIHWTDNPTPALLPPPGSLGIANSGVVVVNGTWYVLYDALIGGTWAMYAAEGPSPTMLTTVAGPLASLSKGGAYGAPWLTYSKGHFTIEYLAGASGNLGTNIYKAVSTNFTTWSSTTAPVLSMALPWEVDQVGDPSLACGILYFSGANNAASYEAIGAAFPVSESR